MKQNSGDVKNKSFFQRNLNYIIFAVIAVILGLLAGHSVAANAGKKGIDWSGVSESLESCLSVGGFFEALVAALNGGKYEQQGLTYGFIVGGALVFIGAMSPKKRMHRKGSEHGSAHWGTEEEKRIIRDNADFFNNAIIASDVFLVLDRKKRDENEKKHSLIPRKKTDDNERHDRLIEEIKSHSPVGNGTEVESGVLKRYVSYDKNIEIPAEINGSRITSIGDFAFTGCADAETITIPESIKSIGKGAFSGCAELRSVSALGVKNVGVSAFEDCTSLSDITFSNSLKSIGGNAFKNCPQVDFYCPTGSSAAKYAAKNYIYSIDNSSSLKSRKLSANQVINASKSAQKIKPMLNLNMIVLGGSGTGKSRFFVKPNLMQMNCSFVVTDPSGELLESCGMMLKRNGYEIKVFNIDNMSHSDNYNPFYYLKEFGTDTGRKYKPENVVKMINTFMLNTKGEGQGADPFWDNATEIFLSAIIFYMLEDLPEEEWNWSKVLEIVHSAEVDEDKKTKSDFDLLFDEYRDRCEREGRNSLALQSYTEFTQAAGKTMQSILINTTARLKNFKLQEVINLTSTDTIHLESLGDKKTALFIIIPSTDSTYNYLASLMYTQLFDTLYSQAIHKYHGRLPIHVSCILDEFANTGKIPDFDKVLATCRKFEISAVVILQNLSQLKRIYEKSWEELPGNCVRPEVVGA